MKTCLRCQVEKEETEFNKRQKAPDGLQSWCKKCAHGAVMLWREQNVRKAKASDRASIKKWQAKNPGVVAQYRRKYKYGISLEKYLALLSDQNNCCAICGDEFCQGRSPCVDHCHATKNVRGLLCTCCNVGVGFFKDSSIRLQKAAAYLQVFN